jgi:DNA topoisomerase VI subunit B
VLVGDRILCFMEKSTGEGRVSKLLAAACLVHMFAGRLIQELQTNVDEQAQPQNLSSADAAKLHSLLRSAHFAKPDGKHLSPAGEYNLRLGVIKELHPDLIATHQGVQHIA